MRYDCMSIRTATFKIMIIPNAIEDVEQQEFWYTAGKM